MKRWWISSIRATFCIETQNGIIVKAAPIARRFIGQHIKRLLKWFKVDLYKKLETK